jgi:hypothetical protein
MCSVFDSLAGNWSAIQTRYFPAQKGTAFQAKLKDKWRVLYQGLRKKGATRSHVPQHQWEQIEALAKLHPVG